MRKKNLMTLNLQFFAEGEVSRNTMEVAEPSEVTTEDVNSNVEGTDSTEVEPETQTEQTEVQSTEDNARFAAARRRAEQEYAERQKLEDAEFERRFKGYENPITHQPIRSKKDYFEALDAQERMQMEQNLASGKVDVDTLNSYIENQIANNPAVMQAQKILEQQKQTELQTRLENDLKAIQKLDSSVKSIDDVMASDNAQTIIDYVRNGLSLADAYKMANFDALMNNRVNASKQAAINNIKGTQHLNSTDGVSAVDNGEVDIPQSELSTWRRAYPDISMKELRAKYNRVIKS